MLKHRPSRLHNENFDVLGDIFSTLRFRGTIFFSSELAAPWGMAMPQWQFPRFHICLNGSFYVGAEGKLPVRLEQNDIILLPDGNQHWIADQPGRKLIASDKVGQSCELGNPLFQKGKITHKVMCGMVHYDENHKHPIFDSLPDLMHFPAFPEDESIRVTTRLLTIEIERSQSIDNPIVDRLSEVLFLKLLHLYTRNTERDGGFFAALNDRRLRHAITLIHEMPEEPWSLESLGEQAGMSRATLVRRFEKELGMTPMAYLRQWRVTKAHSLVKSSAKPIEQIALEVGFASSRSLNKAFSRYFDYTPAELRRYKKA